MRRPLASVALACGLLAGLAVPSSAFSYWCSYDGSTRLLTAQDRTLRVWVQEGPYGSTSVCFLAGDVLAGSLDVYVAAPAPFVPDVAVTELADCHDRLDVTQEQPVPVSVLVEADVSGGREACVGFGGTSYAISVTLPPATQPAAVRLTLDRHAQATDAYCAARPEATGCAGGFAEIQLL